MGNRSISDPPNVLGLRRHWGRAGTYWGTCLGASSEVFGPAQSVYRPKADETLWKSIKSMKINENQWKSMKINENQWKSMKINGNQ